MNLADKGGIPSTDMADILHVNGLPRSYHRAILVLSYVVSCTSTAYHPIVCKVMLRLRAQVVRAWLAVGISNSANQLAPWYSVTFVVRLFSKMCLKCV